MEIKPPSRFSMFGIYTIIVCGVITWLICASICALWWLPNFMGKDGQPLAWVSASGLLASLWVVPFNHWPRVGTKAFLRDHRPSQFHITMLLIVTASFAFGFAVT